MDMSIDIDRDREWDQPLWDLTPLSPSSTGISGWIFVAVNLDDQAQPVMRLSNQQRVDKAGIWVGLSIPQSGEPQIVTPVPASVTDDIIEAAKKWIVLNRDVLLAHWHGQCDAIELCRQLQKLC